VTPVDNVEDAVAFLAALNGGSCPPFSLDGDGTLVARLADGDVMLWREAFAVDDPDTGVTELADGEVTNSDVLDWSQRAVEARVGPLEAESPDADAALRLCLHIEAALAAVEGWLWTAAEAAAAGIAHDPPCGCASALDPEHGDLHTQRQHRVGSCGGPSAPAPCGGCYDCLAAQAAYSAGGDR